ncbi:MAG: triphosphoribosyl-dephospho-CoA synthase MdcB [Betaproteobacteria bacterium]|nr:triphosphoribosyl-dephospho-CoA synthase MdcB [Betaproteobacteria bacterium]
MPPDAAAALRRHHWAWLHPAALAHCTDLDPADREFLENWVGNGRPLVVARRAESHRLRLGLTRPGTGARRRIGVTVAPEAVLRSMPPLSLAAVEPHAPQSWKPALQRLQVLAAEQGLDIRVYGSLALQYFSPWPCVRPDSDLDLLLELDQVRPPQPLLEALQALQADCPAPRIDGEVRRGEWAVPWRELARAGGRSGWLLAKSDTAVALRREPGWPARVARAAVRALYQELMLAPKPGLVSPVDNGAHEDMTPATFVRSLFALRRYFARIAEAGAAGASFAELQALGRAAEARMLKATGGINAHRGAIFNLGLVAAAAGACPGADARTLCLEVAQRWGQAIRDAASSAPEDSHGRQVAARHGLKGARGQAAQGFPVLREQGLPAFEEALRTTGDARRASLAAFFAMMAVLDDSNLAWRGGMPGLRFAQAQGKALAAPAAMQAPDWEARAWQTHRTFVARNLSPGGSADLLALLLMLRALDPPLRPVTPCG